MKGEGLASNCERVFFFRRLEMGTQEANAFKNFLNRSMTISSNFLIITECRDRGPQLRVDQARVATHARMRHDGGANFELRTSLFIQGVIYYVTENDF